MKIVFITNNSNGLYLFRRQLISTLIGLGHDVIALTPFDSDVDNLKKLGMELIETPIDRRGKNLTRDFALMRLYKNELKRISPDLVITYTIKPNVYGGIECKHLNIPYVTNITGCGTAFEGGGMLRKLVTVLNRVALKKASKVFFENNENRDFFVQEGIVDKNKTYVLSGAGVDIDYFYYQQYPNNTVFRFLFIGRVMKEKGVDELLQSMKRLVSEGIQCSLDILGCYEENYKDKLDEAEKEGYVRYYEHQADVRPFIAACDCFVLPSFHEGMANTNLECASSGRPLITSNISGCREAVVNESGILCEPKNVESLYSAMKVMVKKSREDRIRMGQIGRKHMEEVFDKRKVVADTIKQLFEE